MKMHLKINITYDSLIFFAILILYGNLNIAIPLLITILIHETGHILPVLLFGGKINTLTLNAGGLNLSYDSTNFTYLQDIICSISGPALGVISAMIASNFNMSLFSGLSICINIFNLIPLRPLDGGKILSSILKLFFDMNYEFILRIFETIVILCLYSLAIIVYINSGKLILLVICTVLTFYYCKER